MAHLDDVPVLVVVIPRWTAVVYIAKQFTRQCWTSILKVVDLIHHGGAWRQPDGADAKESVKYHRSRRTQTGSTYRLRGAGIQRLNVSGKGDLLVHHRNRRSAQTPWTDGMEKASLEQLPNHMAKAQKADPEKALNLHLCAEIT